MCSGVRISHCVSGSETTSFAQEEKVFKKQWTSRGARRELLPVEGLVIKRVLCLFICDALPKRVHSRHGGCQNT
jgi:hypothetical protein